MHREIKLTYDDVMIVPEAVSNITSRSECNPYDQYGMLPIFTAPMSTVVNEYNYTEFLENGIGVVMPRSVSFEYRLGFIIPTTKDYGRTPFVAMSITEARDFFIEETSQDPLTLCKIAYNEGWKSRICIDVANGHMFNLLELVKEIKQKYGDSVEIMTGNIANPNTIRLYEMAGVDYCRVSIGTGSGCLTASNTGIYYPQFSLLEEIYKIKKEENIKCKIVADGGIRGYRDIQKALIFADYVMIGGLFNKAVESAGTTTYGNFYFNFLGKKRVNVFKNLLYKGKEVGVVSEKLFNDMRDGKVELYKEFYGMSTKKAQLVVAFSSGESVCKKLKTSEGVVKKNPVEFKLSSWVENETDYLKSAMSYTNSKSLAEYKGSDYIIMNKIQFNN